MTRVKISLIGSGQIGSTLAMLSSIKELGDVVLFDIVQGMPEGKSLDLSHMSAIEGSDCILNGSNNFECIKNSDVIIVTAGVARKPGMSRDDLWQINSKIIIQVAEAIKLYSPNAFVICITNPLDSMVALLLKHTNMPHHMICGMAGVLDAARFKSFLAEKLNVSVESVQTIILGGHGDSMVPLPRFTSVGGIPLLELVKMNMISNEEIEMIIQRTRDGGGEIVSLLKTGSAYYAPASAAIEMAESFLKDKKKILSCAAYLQGHYGIDGMYIGVPCIIGKNGVEKILELKLTEEERKMLIKSFESIQSLSGQSKSNLM